MRATPSESSSCSTSFMSPPHVKACKRKQYPQTQIMGHEWDLFEFVFWVVIAATRLHECLNASTFNQTCSSSRGQDMALLPLPSLWAALADHQFHLSKSIPRRFHLSSPCTPPPSSSAAKSSATDGPSSSIKKRFDCNNSSRTSVYGAHLLFQRQFFL